MQIIFRTFLVFIYYFAASVASACHEGDFESVYKGHHKWGKSAGIFQFTENSTISFSTSSSCDLYTAFLENEYYFIQEQVAYGHGPHLGYPLMELLMDRSHVTVGTILAFFRFTAFFAIAPFPGALAPMPVRVILSAGLAWAFGAGITADPQTSSLWGAVLVEVFLGLAMGFLLLIVFQAFVGAGEAAGTHMSVASAGYVDLHDSSQITVMGKAFSYIAMGIFALTDGPAMMCALLQQSLSAMPPGTFSHRPDALTIVMTGGSELFRVAVHVAAPIIASVFAAHLVLMVLTRAIPNFNVFIEGPALTVATGTFGLWASVHTFAPMIEEQFTLRYNNIAQWLFM